MKVSTIIGTRPEIIRLSRVMVALDRYVEQVIIHTGQNYDYELNQVFLMILRFANPTTFWKRRGSHRRKQSASSSRRWMRFWLLKNPMLF